MNNFWNWSLDEYIAHLGDKGIDVGRILRRNIVIGISGRKGVGKTTTANKIIEEVHSDYDLVVPYRVSFASTIKRTLDNAFYEAFPYVLRRNVGDMDGDEKAALRSTLQWMGIGFRNNFHPDFLVNAAFSSILNHSNQGCAGIFVIDDVRFQNEREFISRFRDGLELRIDGTIEEDADPTEMLNFEPISGLKVYRSDAVQIRKYSQEYDLVGGAMAFIKYAMNRKD